MHNGVGRINAVFFFALSVLGIAGFMSAVSVMNHHPQVTAQVTNHYVSNIRTFFHPLFGSRVSDAHVAFDLNLDLSDEWNWNVKQIFVYITADYEADGKSKNSVVIWDRIMTKNEILHLSREQNEYSIMEKAKIKGLPMKLVVHYDVMPLIGWMKRRSWPDQAYNFVLNKK